MVSRHRANGKTSPARAVGAVAAPLVFVRNEAGRRGVPLAASFTHWVTDTLRGAGRRRRTEVNILIVGADAGRDFNRRFRNRDYATNVLSFPYEPMPHERSALIGDLVICAPVIALEAIAQEKNSRDHYAHLTIHGVLHLLGFDHVDDADAARMEALERRLLHARGIADPYREQVA